MNEKTIDRLCGMVPSSMLRRMLRRYLFIRKYSGAQVAALAGRELLRVLKFRLRHRKDYQVISLGNVCLPRIIATDCGLKPDKKSGELSMPFDLALTPAASLKHFLETDFSDYFEGLTLVKPMHDWLNLRHHLDFQHDAENGRIPREILVAKLQKRIENFRAALHSPRRTVFLQYNSCNGDSPEAVAGMIDKLKELRGELGKNDLYCVVYNNEGFPELPGAAVRHVPCPENHTWSDKISRSLPAGAKFEFTIIRFWMDCLESAYAQKPQARNHGAAASQP